ncbi:MAG: NlpA lipoprotein [Clostridia bacterium]|jgi:NitT/TauT family transport system substrate-binding protein|nr:NlpA lipoprotein [Clostridia bacterium]
MKRITTLLIALLLTGMMIFTGCQATPATPAAPETPAAPVEDMKLKIGIMPAVDSAPILLAEKKGYFKDLGLDIDIQVYNNAANRESALQSGELDGTMTDLIAFVNSVQNGLDVKITTSTDGSFPFLLKKGFVEQKKIKIGMMEVSVSNFLSDQFLKDKYEMEKVFINEIPARLEMVKAGQLDMANLPEPIASMGELGGLEKVVYANVDNFMPEAMIFTGKTLKEKGKALEAFHEAYNKAVADIKANDEEARDVLIEKLQLKPEIKKLMALPEYNMARVPDEAYLNKVIAWIEEVQKIDITVAYDQMIERKFIK